MILPDGIKPNIIERILTMPAKPIALIALAVSLLALYAATGRSVEGLESAAKMIASEAMTGTIPAEVTSIPLTVGTNGL